MTQYRTKDSSFDDAVLEFKKKYLYKLLQKNAFNISKVGRITKLSRATIYKLIGYTKQELFDISSFK